MERKSVRVVNINAIDSFTFPGGLRVRRLITKKREDSGNLLLGIAMADPGEGLRWSYAKNDEVYFIVRGKITLKYGEEEVEAGEGDAVYLPMGWDYELKNTGTEPMMLVYVLSPSPE